MYFEIENYFQEAAVCIKYSKLTILRQCLPNTEKMGKDFRMKSSVNREI